MVKYGKPGEFQMTNTLPLKATGLFVFILFALIIIYLNINPEKSNELSKQVYDLIIKNKLTKIEVDVDGLNMDFVLVEGGCYQMGCGKWAGDCWDREKPEHEVCVDDFYMGQYEVTLDQFRKFVKAENYKGEKEKRNWGCNNMLEVDPEKFRQTGKHPATCVTWNEAKAL